ncbi:hypothetical protein LX32DRAFT_177365 [Colletotrichum zoysiae]|uniref:Secreted protein n=1 Tax=Colletotrichum zoysiae TaxID=1216348 RepID=A0AAD9H7J1_9PEZI|nr:hypothetical protein LX32DRAFT_177365 [Colletotrichum zoysiae]
MRRDGMAKGKQILSNIVACSCSLLALWSSSGTEFAREIFIAKMPLPLGVEHLHRDCHRAHSFQSDSRFTLNLFSSLTTTTTTNTVLTQNAI